MGNQVDNKFTWLIKDFCSQQSEQIYSDEFVVDGCKWRLLAFPKGNIGKDNVKDQLSLYLDVAGFLPVGWRRKADVYFSIVNQRSEELSQTKKTTHWFDASARDWGFHSMFALNKLCEKDSGFLVNGELKIVVKVSVLEVIGKLDVPEESEEKFKAERMIEENDAVESNNLPKEALSVTECMDVSGFRVLPSQVESLRRIFERYPDITSEFRPKNQHLRSSLMNVLLGLIETICQSTQELSKDDLAYTNDALGYLMAAGLKLEWLEEKLKKVSEKKEIAEAGETRMRGIEEELKVSKRKCSDLESQLKESKQKCSKLEAQLEKEKALVSVAKAPLTLDDLV